MPTQTTDADATPQTQENGRRTRRGRKKWEVKGDRERAIVGGIGALIPVLAVLYAGGAGEIKPHLILQAAIACGVGGLIAWAQPEVTSRFSVIQLGMGVPALLASSIVAGEARHQRNLADAAQLATAQAETAPAPVASDPSSSRGLLPSLFGMTVLHAETTQTKTLPKANTGLFEYLGLKERRDWFVVVDVYPVAGAAQRAARNLRNRQAEVYKIPNRDLYAVVLGEGLTYSQATAKRNEAIRAGLPKTTHVWSVELAPKAPSPVCAQQEIGETTWKDFSKSFDQPAYAYVGPIDRNASGFRVKVAFPSQPQRFDARKYSESAFDARTRGMPSQWLSFSNNAPRERAKTVTAGNATFEVTVPKVDFGGPTDDDVDVRVCRVR